MDGDCVHALTSVPVLFLVFFFFFLFLTAFALFTFLFFNVFTDSVFFVFILVFNFFLLFLCPSALSTGVTSTGGLAFDGGTVSALLASFCFVCLIGSFAVLLTVFAVGNADKNAGGKAF